MSSYDHGRSNGSIYDASTWEKSHGPMSMSYRYR